MHPDSHWRKRTHLGVQPTTQSHFGKGGGAFWSASLHPKMDILPQNGVKKGVKNGSEMGSAPKKGHKMHRKMDCAVVWVLVYNPPTEGEGKRGRGAVGGLGVLGERVEGGGRGGWGGADIKGLGVG